MKNKHQKLLWKIFVKILEILGHFLKNVGETVKKNP